MDDSPNRTANVSVIDSMEAHDGDVGQSESEKIGIESNLATGEFAHLAVYCFIEGRPRNVND